MEDYPQYVGSVEDPNVWGETFRMVGTPEAMGELFSALAQARAEFPAIPKDATGKVVARNGGERTFRFSSLTSIMGAVAGPLGKHGLALTQPVVSRPGGKTRVLTILGKGAAFLETAIEFDNPQTGSQSPEADLKAFGGRVTYIRRYGLKGLLSVEGDDDADAEPIDERQDQPKPEPMGRPGRPPGRPPRQAQEPPQAAPRQAPVQQSRPPSSPPPAPKQAAPQAVPPTIPRNQPPEPPEGYHDTELPPPPEAPPQQAPGYSDKLQPGSADQQEDLLTLVKKGVRPVGVNDRIGLANLGELRAWVGALLKREVTKEQLKGQAPGFVTSMEYRNLIGEARLQTLNNGLDPDKVLAEKKGT